MTWTDTDWPAEAEKAAAYVLESETVDSVGVMRWGPPGITAVYGALGDKQEQRRRARLCNEILRRFLSSTRIDIVATGQDSQSRAWAVLVDADALELIDALAQEAWEIAGSLDAQ